MNYRFLVSIIIFWPLAIYLDGLVDEQRRELVFDILIWEVFIGSAPNFISSFLIPIPFVFIQNGHEKFLKLLLSMMVGLILYEMIQLFDKTGTFDVLDVLFTVLGTLFCYLGVRCFRPPNPDYYKRS
jgi:glycopeptide antibiotics resistance protein